MSLRPRKLSRLRQEELGSNVAGYRVYCLDGVRKVASGEWIEADDDEAAIDAARDKYHGYDCEVWQGSRLVAQVRLERHG